MQKSPIKLPKEPEPRQVIQPDVIPTQHSQPVDVPPPAAFTNSSVAEQQDIVNPPDEQLYSNATSIVEQEAKAQPVEPQSPVKEQVPTQVATQVTTEEATEHIDPIYQNQDDLTEYIEDTGVKAVKHFGCAFLLNELIDNFCRFANKQVAMYDYQAAADDEISFDPDDIITHIEQVKVILPCVSKQFNLKKKKK